MKGKEVTTWQDCSVAASRRCLRVAQYIVDFYGYSRKRIRSITLLVVEIQNNMN